MTRPCLTALLSGALFAAAACGGHPDPQAATAPAPPSATGDTVVLTSDSPMLKQLHRERVAVRDLPTDEIVAPGKLEVNPNRVSKVVLPVAGRVATVLVKIGDAVKKDQPLLTIQSPDADSAMSSFLSARAAEGQADVALGKAQADADRAADLFEHNAVAKKDVQAADSALAQAKAAVEQARATREQSARRLSVLGLSSNGFDQQVVVRAPLSGKVLELSVVPGEFRNDTTAPVMTIADLSTVWVGSQVPETYIRFVQIGERVEISLVAYPGETFEGRVSRIADTVDPATRTVKVQAELDNPKGLLRPEMYGSIHHIESTKPTTVIPAGAVIQSGDRSTVFVETSPGRFVQRTVSIGPRAGDMIRVVSGVSEGDVVVSDGAMLLQGLLRRS
ncbi:MAG TPA: efflux RND transporter periplasmic adaptor subunit [Vicinamibacterales bacterium]|nr:efflux RND transporter periplasmic adaptor subunit [Vicinamibacterales bacterium]